jgi:predicted phosphodiesterase
MNADPITEEIRKTLKKFPDTDTRTLARRISKEFEITIEQARSRIRRQRGASGARSRKKPQDTHRPLKEAGSYKPVMPPSLAEPWVPFELDGSKNVGVIADIHIPFHAEKPVKMAIDTLKKAKIDTLLVNGDAGDWYTLSRFEKNPKYRDKKAELNAQREFWKYLRYEFPKARIIFKKGNHDERWEKWVWNGGLAEFHDEPLLQLDVWLGLQQLGVEIVGDQRIIMAGKLPILHGHELPKGIANPVSPARGAFLRGYHSVMVSHSHVPGSFVAVDLFHKSMVSWSTGCLCTLNPEYARINQWAWGFATIRIAQDKTYDVTNKRVDYDFKVRGTDA